MCLLQNSFSVPTKFTPRHWQQPKITSGWTVTTNPNPYLYTLITKFNIIRTWTLTTNARPRPWKMLSTLQQIENSSITNSTFWIFPAEYFLRGNSKIRRSFNASLPHLLPNTSSPGRGGPDERHRPLRAGPSPATSRTPPPPSTATARAPAPPRRDGSGCPAFPHIQAEWRTQRLSSLERKAPRTPQHRRCQSPGSTRAHLTDPAPGDGPGSGPVPVPPPPYRPPAPAKALSGPRGLHFPPLRRHTATASSQNQSSFRCPNELLITDAGIQRKTPEERSLCRPQALARPRPSPPRPGSRRCRCTSRSAPPRPWGEATGPPRFPPAGPQPLGGRLTARSATPPRLRSSTTPSLIRWRFWRATGRAQRLRRRWSRRDLELGGGSGRAAARVLYSSFPVRRAR